MTTRGGRVVRAGADAAPRDPSPPDAAVLRRRVVVAITLAIGTTLLGFSLATTPGDRLFYPLTLGVALVWVVGAVLSGPLHLGHHAAGESLRRPVAAPIVLGLAAGAVFVLGALVVREIGPVHHVVAHVLAHAEQGNRSLVTVLALVTGAAEEVFFRGALFAAIGHRAPVRISTAIYAVVTIATGNPMLVFAAVVMGTVWAAQRQASGGILAPLLTHVTWSAVMLLALPPLFS